MIDKLLGAILGFGAASMFSKDKYAKGGSTYQGGGEIIKNTIVYDNEGETLDRYTVFTPDGSVYAMSENAKGFNQYVGEAVEDNIEQGSHLGKKLKSVPKEIEWAIIDRMNYAKGGSTYQGGGEVSFGWAKKYLDDANEYKKLSWYIMMGKGVEKTIDQSDYILFNDGSALKYNEEVSEWQFTSPKRIDKNSGKGVYQGG